MSTKLKNTSLKTIPPHGYISEIADILKCSRITVSNAIRHDTRGIKAEKARQLFKKKYCNDD